MQNAEVQLIYIDLFCGAGGTSTGVEAAINAQGNKVAKVIACVNHDENAINSHYSNHPDVEHFTEDIRTLSMEPLKKVVAKAREKYPNALLVICASLECTNFSNAKGGKPKDADSRTLADHLDRYILALKPDYVQIENVREFQYWGDLDKNGKPISRLKGRLFKRWIKRICSYGYNEKRTMLNAANFGAYTSRDRLFIYFAKYGLPITFPEPTHAKNPQKTLFGECEKWKPVKEVLDFSNEGKTIFGRKRPIVENTLKRIYSGLVNEVANGVEPPKSFLTEYYGNGVAQSINKPIGTLTTKYRHAKIHLTFLDKQYGSGSHNHQSVDVPAGSLTTVPKLNLVSLKCGAYLFNPQWGGCTRSLDRPCFTLIARMDKAPPYLIQTEKGELAILIEENDTPMTKKIKAFMAYYGIIDIKMRMLMVDELLEIQGFGKDYKLIGTQAEQKKYIGNAVHPLVAKAMTINLVQTLNNRMLAQAV